MKISKEKLKLWPMQKERCNLTQVTGLLSCYCSPTVKAALAERTERSPEKPWPLTRKALISLKTPVGNFPTHIAQLMV